MAHGAYELREAIRRGEYYDITNTNNKNKDNNRSSNTATNNTMMIDFV